MNHIEITDFNLQYIMLLVRINYCTAQLLIFFFSKTYSVVFYNISSFTRFVTFYKGGNICSAIQMLLM